jgi:hypothetical protein
VKNKNQFENIIYTESVSYPIDLPEPIQDRPWYQVWLQRMIALVFVFATVFLFGGIYQLSLVQQTPESTPAGSYENLIDQPERSIPTSLYVLTEDGSSKINTNNLITKTNAILQQAAVELSLQRTNTIAAKDLPAGDKQIAGSPSALRDQLPELNPSHLNVVVADGLAGVNGVAFVGTNVVAVAEYNATFDFRVLAHEVGHILALEHTPDRRNLMRSGGSGTTLTQSQAQQVYRQASRFVSDT